MNPQMVSWRQRMRDSRAPESWAAWVGKVAIVALAYYVTGRLGLLLAIPPGYATAVWPPSGIALAATLLFGYRVGPGVWLGSFLVNSGTSALFDPSSVAALVKSLAIAATIGMGAVLQALAGTFLIRRVVGFPNALDRERDIAKFLVLGALSCLVNATFGSVTLWVFGAVSSSGWLFSWWTWWVGDAIGVLIFTPLILIFAAPPHPAWRRRRWSVTVPLVGTFSLAVLVFFFVSHQEQERVRSDFEQKTRAMTDQLNERFATYLQTLYAIQGLYVSSEKVERDEFHTYVARPLAALPGIQALAWIPRVTHAQRARFEATARRSGYRGFQFTELDDGGELVPARPRDEYFPVYFIEPYRGNEKVLGFDTATHEVRRDTMELAGDLGEPAATPPVPLMQFGKTQPGVVIAVPVYAAGTRPADVATRRATLRGFVAGDFVVAHAVDIALQAHDRRNIVLRIDDQPSRPGNRLYGPARVNDTGSAFHWTSYLSLGGREWVLRYTATPDYVVAYRSWAAWLVLAGGLFFTSLLGAFLLMLTGRSSRVERLVAERTTELSRANAKLARSNAELEQFAYVASHDLQEPLRMVTNYTQLLERRYRGKLDADADDFIGFAVSGAQRMHALIQDLLTFSRVGSRGGELVRCDLNQALEWATHNLKMAIDESGAQVTHDPLPQVFGELSQLGQVFQNLIGNAIKFRGLQAPRIHVSAELQGVSWRISIRDNGLGIDPQYHERIFIIFQRLHDRQSYPGTGIGLALCRKIIQRHGGEIGVTSVPDNGSTFHFVLPAIVD